MGAFILGIVTAVAAFQTPAGTSAYPIRLEDPHAVYVSAPADGQTDDTAAIQEAIDKVTGSGIVFLPSGKYRITDTLRVWPGVRVIGYGPARPTLYLAPNTVGYQQSERLMVFFAGRKPRDGQKLNLDKPRGSGLSLEFNGEASPGTFYSAMDNVDIEIGNGNPMAVGVRGRYAQHCYLAHMDFRLGTAMAGIHDTGNSAFDLRFFGGRSGIITRTPSPGWQFTLLDSMFEGQTEAAIRTYETGLTLIRPTFRHVPTAVSVEPDHTEMLWMSDARLEDISGPAILFGREESIRTQINVVRAVCRNVPVFAKGRESGRETTAPRNDYEVSSFFHGYSGNLSEGEATLQDGSEIAAPGPTPPAPSDVRALPDLSTWVNLAQLGAKGDGETDDTQILQDAIDKHRTIYLPQGKYRVSKTIHLRPDTVLIGLHPFTTQILIKDGTPAFAGVGAGESDSPYGPPPIAFPGDPVPLIETPKEGDNILTGIGLDTGGNNPAATACKWMAGKASMINDVKFLGGHGSVPWNQIYNANHTADPNPARRWDSQYPSLWVTDGGGGTFLNIWTASTFAAAGMEISNTSTPGRVYQLSSEHHVRNEVKLRNVAHWAIYSLQTEEERGESPFALPIDIESCSDIALANLVMYRVISMEQPYPYAIRVARSRIVELRGVHCNSNSKAAFDSLVFDPDNGAEFRTRDVGSLMTGIGRFKTPGPTKGLQKLAGGFFNISGGAVDPRGDFYFVDAHFNRVYRWDSENGGLSTVMDNPLSPVNMFFDPVGNLVVVSYLGQGTVFALRAVQPILGRSPSPQRESASGALHATETSRGQDQPAQSPLNTSDIVLLKPQPAAPHPQAVYALPVSDFDLNRDLIAGKPWRFPFVFASPDGTTLLPVDQSFLNGDLSWGVKAQAVIRSFGLAKARPGDTVYLTGENDYRTYSARVQADGSLADGKLFCEQGGEGVAVGPDGNVYLAAGQIYIYDPHGKQIGEIRVPERPIQLVFGGPDGRTLFIAARTSLYAIKQ